MAKRSHIPVHDATSASTSPAWEAQLDESLARLVERARWLDGLDHSLRQSLPPALAPHCRLTNVDQDKLVFLVNAPVWKAKLRLHADALVRAATAAGLSVRSLVVKVVPSAPSPPGNSVGKPLSQAVRDSLRATALSVEDPELRAQLLKLASLP